MFTKGTDMRLGPLHAAGLLLLSGCVALGPADRGNDFPAVCAEQAAMAAAGTTGGGTQTITCPT